MKDDNSDNIGYPILKPDGDKITGGCGDPRQCQPPSKLRQFHDGARLSSRGRWDVHKRIWCETPFWQELREKKLETLQHLADERKLSRQAGGAGRESSWAAVLLAAHERTLDILR